MRYRPLSSTCTLLFFVQLLTSGCFYSSIHRPGSLASTPSALSNKLACQVRIPSSEAFFHVRRSKCNRSARAIPFTCDPRGTAVVNYLERVWRPVDRHCMRFTWPPHSLCIKSQPTYTFQIDFVNKTSSTYASRIQSIEGKKRDRHDGHRRRRFANGTDRNSTNVPTFVTIS